MLAELAPTRAQSKDVQIITSGAPASRSGDQAHWSFQARYTTNLGADMAFSTGESGYKLEWEGLYSFIVKKDGSLIECNPLGGSEFMGARSLIYGMVLPFALHLKGISNLHAGAVVTPHGAVGLVASNGTGKSTLTAQVAAAGNPFLTDDILALTESGGQFLAHPAYPYVSLSPAAQDVVMAGKPAPSGAMIANDDKQRVRVDGSWASFSADPAPLRALFVLQRDDAGTGRVKVEKMPKILALQAIFENTVCLPFLPRENVENHLAFSSRLATAVPVLQLSFPSGFQHTRAVTAEIFEAIR